LLETLENESAVVEVGCFRGRSTCYLLQEMVRRRKRWRVTAVDHFQGSLEHHRRNKLAGVNLKEEFFANLRQAGVAHLVQTLAMPSVKAANRFPDRSLDAVIIDAGHDYPSVRQDILAWRDKVKPDGILCGDDFTPGWPGVQRAVRELIPHYQLLGRCWKAEMV
jgi:SAM-dependent methyltransferase